LAVGLVFFTVLGVAAGAQWLFAGFTWNIGIVLGLAQFLSTVVVMLLYCRYAKRRLDPALDAVRARAGVAS